MKKIHTSRDAARNRDKFEVWNDLHAKAAKELERIMALLKAHPEIGVLTRDGVAIYYVNAPAYVEAADPALLVEAVENARAPKLKGSVGQYHVWHRGQNDYVVTEGATGRIVATRRQFGEAWAKATHLHDHPEAR